MPGVDIASYYWFSPDDRRYYMDFTGRGHTLNMVRPRVLHLIMDRLRMSITYRFLSPCPSPGRSKHQELDGTAGRGELRVSYRRR
jgi:hypothetical protein